MAKKMFVVEEQFNGRMWVVKARSPEKAIKMVKDCVEDLDENADAVEVEEDIVEISVERRYEIY